MTGDWKYKMSWKMSADAEPQVTEGTTETKWIMDGRFIESVTKGEAMGKSFEGRAIMGYDNVKEEYTSIWLDNMSTGIMHSTGEYDEASKTLTEKGQFTCPMTGEKDKEFRGEMKWIDDDHYTYEMYQKGEDGEEFKSLDIQYERA